jgi:uncharacterized membrane protein
MDKVVEKLVALGVPGLVLLVAIATSGLAGGAAIVAALAVLGGPLGMLGGIGMLAVLTLVSNAVAKYGMTAIFRGVARGLRDKGKTTDQIRRELNRYPISAGLKRRVLEELAQS